MNDENADGAPFPGASEAVLDLERKPWELRQRAQVIAADGYVSRFTSLSGCLT